LTLSAALLTDDCDNSNDAVNNLRDAVEVVAAITAAAVIELTSVNSIDLASSFDIQIQDVAKMVADTARDIVVQNGSCGVMR
jgi:hypothetical protein